MSRWMWSLAVTAVCLQGSVQARAQEARQDQNNQNAITLIGGEQNIDPNQPLKTGFQISISTQSAGGTPEPDLSGLFVVDAAGSVTLKLVGPVQVKALTASQASDKIAALLKPYIKDPKVTVSITQVPKPIIFLSGAVGRQGAMPVNDDTHLAELLTIMGFNDNSDLSRVRVIQRGADDKRVTKEYNFYLWLKPGPGQAPDEAQNPKLSDKDIVFVPQKVLPGIGTISVEGDVPRPGVLNVAYATTTKLREALSLSGGINPTADRRQVALRRVGQEKTMYFDYDKVEANDPAQNIDVRPDDVIYVPRLDPNQFVNLNGAFARPGKFPYTQPVTLAQVISEAGGVNPYAKTKEGKVIRVAKNGDPTKTQFIDFDFAKIRANKQPDIRLEPGDTISIPQGQPARVYDPFTITQALLSLVFITDRLR